MSQRDGLMAQGTPSDRQLGLSCRAAAGRRDGRHCTIDVVSPLFEGQSAVKRQRLVYKVGCAPYGARHHAMPVCAATRLPTTPLAPVRGLAQAIWEELQEAVHAVDAMTTKTPQEAQ